MAPAGLLDDRRRHGHQLLVRGDLLEQEGERAGEHQVVGVPEQHVRGAHMIEPQVPRAADGQALRRSHHLGLADCAQLLIRRVVHHDDSRWRVLLAEARERLLKRRARVGAPRGDHHGDLRLAQGA